MAARKITTYKIGITGSICTGKSIVLAALQRFGVNVLDAQEMALGILADNPHRLSIRLTEHFGAEVMDARGRLSRKKLMKVLYTNPEKKALFEDKLNPVKREEIKKFLYSPMGSFIRAVEAPMLHETDTKHLYDEVWIVTCPPEVQVKRLMDRDHLTLPEAQLLVDSEWSQEKKAGLSDRVIDNSGDIHQTETQVRKVLDEIKHRVYKVGI